MVARAMTALREWGIARWCLSGQVAQGRKMILYHLKNTPLSPEEKEYLKAADFSLSRIQKYWPDGQTLTRLETLQGGSK